MDEKIDKIQNRLIDLAKENKVVLPDMDGEIIYDIDTMIDKQPLEGLLYDLNLLPECCFAKMHTEVFEGMQDYATYLVIKRLYERMKANESNTSAK